MLSIIVQWLILRSLYFLSTLKLLALLTLAAITDGLTQRSIRRSNGLRESATVYHQAKALAVLTFIVMMMLTLFAPIALELLQTEFIALSVFVAYLIQLITQQFKKYL